MKNSEQDAIKRALTHHETRGTIEFLSPPGGGRAKSWRVKLRHYPDYLDLTWKEAHILCVALAAAETQALSWVTSGLMKPTKGN